MTNILIPTKQITTTSNQQIVEQKNKTVEKKKDRREGKGRILALSRRTHRLLNSDVYYIESESSDNIYYYVKYNPSVFEWCSCPDNSTRHVKCKHLFAIEFAIKWGIIKDTDKLPASAEAKRYGATVTVSKSYEEDEYSF